MDKTGMSSFEQEPIAIVGMGCRFPGGPNPLAFWKMLREGREAIREVPADRWDVEALYDPDPAQPGKMMSRWGGFIDNVAGFDWRAFRISPREGKHIDPQHRLLLEVAWEAFEDAGLPLEKIAGSQTGVFIGICWNDYLRLQSRNWSQLDGYTAAGNPFAFAANRLSYFFDLRGPSLAMDATCASSLASLHYACQTLWSGEIDMALAGGVNLILSPDSTIIMSKAGILSPKGKVKALDAQADGFVRGEGGGIVVLKRKSDLLPTDKVYAYVRGVSVNHNGRNEWIMAPSQEAQSRVIRNAYKGSGLQSEEVDYVELHGTGFKRGDPIEVKALGVALGSGGRRERPCFLGSVKTNIGNLEAAAGIASLIKVALSLYYREIPPTLNLEQINPEIPLEELGFEPQLTLGPWPAKDGLPTAGVTVIAFSGVNAHAVLEAAPALSPVRLEDEGPYLLTLSARSPEALKEMAGQYKDFLADAKANPNFSLKDLCYTASVRRSHHEYRLALVGYSRSGLFEALQAYGDSQSMVFSAAGRARPNKDLKVFFFFPGQGQVIGRELITTEPIFRAAVEECDRVFQELGCGTLLEDLKDGSGPSFRTEKDRFMPVLFAQQVGLAALWREWGVEPAAVAGHGAGEVAAAYLAGIVSLKDALEVIAFECCQPGWQAGLVGKIKPKSCGVIFYSATAGCLAQGQVPELGNRPNSFENIATLEQVTTEKYDFYIEIGSSSTVEEIKEPLKKAGQGAQVLSSLQFAKEEKIEMLSGLAKLYTHGYKLNLAALYDVDVRCATLPVYPWQRERIWLDEPTIKSPLPSLSVLQANEVKPGESSFLRKLEGATPATRRQLLEELVREQAREILEFAPDQPLSLRQRLFEAGLDSLSAVQLRNRLQSVLKRPLPAILVFDYPTVEALAAFLDDKVLYPQTSPRVIETTSQPRQEWEVSLLSKIADLSEAEAEALLLEKLAAISGEDF